MHALADSPADFGHLLEQSSPDERIPCFGRRGTAVQNLTPLALSSAEKSVNVQRHKQTKLQTVTDISTPCISACVDIKGQNDQSVVILGWDAVRHTSTRNIKPSGSDKPMKGEINSNKTTSWLIGISQPTTAETSRNKTGTVGTLSD